MFRHFLDLCYFVYFYCFCSIVLYVFLLCCVVCLFTLANKPLINLGLLSSLSIIQLEGGSAWNPADQLCIKSRTEWDPLPAQQFNDDDDDGEDGVKELKYPNGSRHVLSMSLCPLQSAGVRWLAFSRCVLSPASSPLNQLLLQLKPFCTLRWMGHCGRLFWSLTKHNLAPNWKRRIQTAGDGQDIGCLLAANTRTMYLVKHKLKRRK